VCGTHNLRKLWRPPADQQEADRRELVPYRQLRPLPR
jgi:hypothetical protein